MFWNKKVVEESKQKNLEVEKKISEIVRETINNALDKATKEQVNILSLQKDISKLTEEKRTLKDDLADLKKAKELEKIEIEHLVALKEQRMELTIKQKEVQLEHDFQKKELALRQKGYEEMTAHIKKVGEDTKSLYSEILARLPNVNMEINKRSK